MEENVLKDFETFSESPDKYLSINNNSDYYFIKKQDKNFVTKRNIDSVIYDNENDKEKIIVEESYYDVNNGNLIITYKNILEIEKMNEENKVSLENVKIISLNEILKIKVNDTYYLSKEDIDVLTNYKEENAKTYNNKPRKNYF